MSSLSRRWLLQRLATSALFLFLQSATSLPSTQAAVIYVAPSGVDQNPCGLTVQTACGSLGYAISTISSAQRNTIELASGVYTEKGGAIEFSSTGSGLSHDLSVRGTASTIDRAYNGRLFVFATGAGKVTFDGIRFYRGGWSDASSNGDFTGGVMKFTSSDGSERVTFMNCVFDSARNPAKGYAGRGGVAVVSAGAPHFTNCTFSNNWSGIASAFYIQGDAAPVFDKCIFKDSGCFNDGWGGAVVPEGQSAALFRDCVFRNNTCDYGGAVDDGGTATPVFENCTFDANYARVFGGAYYGFGDTKSTFTGCTFYENRIMKGSNGQDFYLSSSSHATFDGCLFDAGPNPVFASDGALGDAKDNSTLVMKRSIVKRYKAYQGVILISIESRGFFESTIFMDNESIRGGALVIERPTSFTNCTFLRNIATDGGAIFMSGKTPVEITIKDCLFNGNTAKNSGGAIKITGPLTVTVSNTVFQGNTAQGGSGGALYASLDTELSVDSSSFLTNTANMGGAIWAEGILVVENSGFSDNALFQNDAASGVDMCGLAAGNGGAIYASLPSSLSVESETTISSGSTGSSTTTTCSINYHLSLKKNDFQRNSAGNSGGGGAIFVDKGVPQCIRLADQICDACTFTDNVAAYGSEIATIPRQLIVAPPSSWELMTPVDIEVGAIDHLGQQLTGAHAPLVVRISLASVGIPDGRGGEVSLTTNASRVIRSGVATFKSLALQLPVTTLNDVDTPLNLTFSCDLSSIGGGSTTASITVPILLLKCANDNGLIKSLDGKCLVEASGGGQQLVAAVVFALVLCGGFAFVFYWSFKNSGRVVETLRGLVRGAGVSLLRLVFEVLELVSGIQAMVNLFLYDINLANLVFVKAAYVALFAISLPPSLAVMKATLDNVLFLWKRIHRKANRAVVHDTTTATTTTTTAGIRTTRVKPAATTAAKKKKKNNEQAQQGMRAASEPSTRTSADADECTPPGQITAIVPISTSSRPTARSGGWDTEAMQVHLARTVLALESDLEYQQTRSKYMQRVLVRLLTEDILLLAFNLYLYLVNQSDAGFAQSRFRKSLEFSILMSAIHFGAQVQNIVIWLHTNKIGEIKRQLAAIEALRRQANS